MLSDLLILEKLYDHLLSEPKKIEKWYELRYG